VTPPRPLLETFLGVMSGLSLWTSMSNFKSVALTVFELLAFNSHWPAAAHTQIERDTSNERIISVIHFVHLAEIINMNMKRLHLKIHRITDFFCHSDFAVKSLYFASDAKKRRHSKTPCKRTIVQLVASGVSLCVEIGLLRFDIHRSRSSDRLSWHTSIATFAAWHTLRSLVSSSFSRTVSILAGA